MAGCRQEWASCLTCLTANKTTRPTPTDMNMHSNLHSQSGGALHRNKVEAADKHGMRKGISKFLGTFRSRRTRGFRKPSREQKTSDAEAAIGLTEEVNMGPSSLVLPSLQHQKVEGVSRRTANDAPKGCTKMHDSPVSQHASTG